MSPEEVISSGPIENKELSVDDIINALGSSDKEHVIELDDKDKKEEIKKDDDKDKVDDKKEVEDEPLDELAELEEDLKEPTDEDLELKTPVQRRALLKDFPEIFKKHPGLESTIYRERAYTELLPTINDAKEALASLQTLERFETDLKQGKTVDIMKAVLADDPQAFAKLADTYMENLAQVDERAYHHVLGNITKDIVAAMIKFGKEKEDTDIQDAASSLYQFMFNSTKWEGKKQLSAQSVVDDTTNVERQKLDKEKQDWESNKQKEHTTKLMNSIDNQIKGTVEKSIDPKSQMSDFVKDTAITKVMSKAADLLKKDTRFQAIVKQLTDKAGKEKFSDESLNRIRSAYYTRYKAILIPIIKSVRSEALKETVNRTSEKEETNDTTERANRVTHDRKTNENRQDKSKPLPGESSLDFLLRR